MPSLRVPWPQTGFTTGRSPTTYQCHTRRAPSPDRATTRELRSGPATAEINVRHDDPAPGCRARPGRQHVVVRDHLRAQRRAEPVHRNKHVHRLASRIPIDGLSLDESAACTCGRQRPAASSGPVHPAPATGTPASASRSANKSRARATEDSRNNGPTASTRSAINQGANVSADNGPCTDSFLVGSGSAVVILPAPTDPEEHQHHHYEEDAAERDVLGTRTEAHLGPVRNQDGEVDPQAVEQ